MSKRNPIQARSAVGVPAQKRRDVTVYSRMALSVRADTANVEAGTVRATISTENPVEMVDWRSWEPIEEILISQGMRHAAQHPMLDSHHRDRCGDVLGSVRDFKKLNGTVDAELAFDMNDPESVRVFHKVVGGHLRDVSVGYRVRSKVDIPAGKTRKVAGKEYTAGSRALRVSTEWDLVEVSPTPVGADGAAKIRSFFEEQDFMNKRLAEFFRQLGLQADPSDEQMAEFRAKLTPQQHAVAAMLNYPEDDTARSAAVDQALRAMGLDPAAPWKELVVQGGNAGNGTGGRTANDSAADQARAIDEARAAGRQAEIARQTAIRNLASLAGDAIDAATVQLAIDGNWEIERAQTAFVAIAQGRRDAYARETQARGNGAAGASRFEDIVRSSQGPAARSFSREQTHNVLSLAVALSRRFQEVEPHQWAFQQRTGGRRYAPDQVPDELNRAFENSHRYSGMSMVDLAVESLRMNGINPVNHNPVAIQEDLRASASSQATLTAVFSSAIYTQVIDSYMMAEDTTGPITTETDVKDFRSNEIGRLETAAKLSRHKRGGTAEHLTFADAAESYRIWPYSGKLKFDWQDFVDDRLNALEGVGPRTLGEAARMLKPRLVIGLMLANEAMRDTVALFHANHGNLFTGVSLTAASIKQAVTAMRKFTENGEPLASSRRKLYAYIPPTLEFAAKQYVSAKISNDSGAGDENPLAGIYEPIVEPRLELGVTNPANDTAYGGSASTWFLMQAASPQGITIAYLLGTNRLPMVRSKQLDDGEWGVSWDVLHSIGGKFADWRCGVKTT